MYTHTKYILVYAYIKNIYRHQRYLQTINSNKTFTETNPAIKKDPTLSK